MDNPLQWISRPLLKPAMRRPGLWPLFRVLPAPNDRIALLKRMPRGAVCAELGVWKGTFSRQILDFTRPRRLYLVDPWRFQAAHPTRMYGGKAARNQGDMDAIHREVSGRFAGDPAVRVRRKTSTEFLDALDTDELDWVYIDGDHSYEAVAADLDRALRAVKPGGFITGDDFRWREPDGTPAVRCAVEEFVARHGLRLKVIRSQYLIAL